MSAADAQVITAVITSIFTFLAVVVGAVAAYTVRRNDREIAIEKDKQAVAQRAVDKADALVAAAQLEQRINQRAAELAETTRLQLEVKRLTDETIHKETIGKIEETHATAHEAVAQAKEAYTEANHANMKIAGLQEDLKATLAKMPGASSVPDAGTDESSKVAGGTPA